MAEPHHRPESNQSHPGEPAHVQAQLHSLLDLSSQMSKGIDLAKVCLWEARVARGAFENLVEQSVAGDRGGEALSEGAASAVGVTARLGADQLLLGLEAQLIVNGAAFTAEKALASLLTNLQLLSRNESSRGVSEVTELHRQAAEVVSNCKGWLKLAGEMARLLHVECTRLDERLSQHARCEQLTTETLLNARQGARIKL